MRYFIGLDIGGTDVKGVLIDENGRVLSADSIPTTSEKGIDIFLENVSKMIVSLKKENTYCVSAIGIGCTGPVDFKSGIILNPYTLSGLEGSSLTVLMQKRFNVPVFIDNDANMAHLGEIALCEENITDSVMLTFGTGVGVSARVNGKLYRTNMATHPEMGHIPIGLHQSTRCYCGHDDCIENILSGDAINKACKKIFSQTPEEVFSLCTTPEKQAYRALLTEAFYKSICIFGIIFAPQIVFIGGGMASFFSQYLIKDVQCMLDKLEGTYGKTRLTCVHTDNLSGSRGAAFFALSRLD